MTIITMEQDNQQDDVTKSPSDFSIDHILNRAGSSRNKTDDSDSSGCGSGIPVTNLPWLRCTRYFPPKIPKNHRRDGPQKRQLGRHPRIPFTSHQLSLLEQKFQESPYLSSEDVTLLSQKLQLADIRVKIWFQNRRARERREKQSPNLKKSPSSSPTLREQENSSSTADFHNFFLTTPLASYFEPLPPR